MLFGGCSVAFVASSLLLLRAVWALGSGRGAWSELQMGLESPASIAYSAVALAAFVYTGVRCFFKLFPKAQPARIGPLKSPPRAAFPPLLLTAWVAASAGVVVVAWGILP